MKMKKKTRIIHVVTGLDVGGAEVMMCRLLERFDRDAFEFSVISLRPLGPLSGRIEKTGLELRSLGITGMFSLIAGLFSLLATLRREKPDIVQTWMYHADLVGSVAAWLAGVPRIVWNVQHSTHCPKGIKLTMRLATWLLARLSRHLPDEIIVCSRVSIAHHVAQGYDTKKMTYICNGAETDVFTPDVEAGMNLRANLGIPQNAKVIGTAGRFHAQKDYPTFFEAAILLQEVEPDVHFVACGPSVTADNPKIQKLLSSSKFPERFHLLGVRSDMEKVYPAFTVSTLCSAFGEGFPLTLGEAMACGVPCVATDVGDSAEIIDDADRIVSPGDAQGLANAWRSILNLSDEDHCTYRKDARSRIETQFGLDDTVRRYQEVYRGLMLQGRQSVEVIETQPYEVA
ncbi:MAG: glycosyltransferase involved in cell wall biosynthesis [Verrucomicrobiales bacterium]|jgi:glycosyltransferase involved in cell wall biosynthesis